MANGVYKFYKDLPAWAKGVVVVGGLAVVYFTAKSIMRKIAEKKNAEDSREAVKDAQNDIKALNNNGVRASYSKTQYKTWANSIQQAFEGCDPSGNVSWGAESPLGAVSVWSTSGYKVATIFNQLKNDVDYLELATAWGIRTYDACGYFTGDVKDVDLIRAITDELTDREVSNLNKVLAKKGIKYKV
jgi:hypothetical protein